MFLFLNTYAPIMLLKLNVLNVILDTYVYCSQKKTLLKIYKRFKTKALHDKYKYDV